MVIRWICTAALTGLLLIPVGVPAAEKDVFIQNGVASFYADRFEGRPTASGEPYTHRRDTAAHLTLPFGTRLRVTNRANGRQVTVRVNDRGPFARDRIVDLSRGAAAKLGFLEQGVAEVRLEVVGEESRPSRAAPPGTGGSGGPETDAPEFYRVRAARHAPRGFGVQIGSYRELTNLMRVADAMPADLKQQVTVQVFHIQRIKVYRIIVGESGGRRAAEDLRNRLLAAYPDCFIYRFPAE